MSSTARVEEGYPLGPIHTGNDDSSTVLPPPITHARRHRGILGRLRAKFYSFRPRVRFLILALCTIVPIYILADAFGYFDDTRWSIPRKGLPPWGEDDERGDGKWPSHDDSNGSHTPKLPPPAPPSHGGIDWAARTEEVKEAFLHAYRGYEKYAFPADELLPLSKGKVNNFNGWGVSSVDSLDTMLMMGLVPEYNRGVQHVTKTNYKAHNDHVPFFETSIRYFGGLLSAYWYTKDPVLLRKAEELGSALLPAFGTPSGYPLFAVRPSDGNARPYWGKDLVILAEMGSVQLEYKYLAHLTGRKEYYTNVERITTQMATHIDSKSHLLPIYFNFDTGAPATHHFSIGALADSAYEYILKQYIQTGKKDKKTLDMYLTLTKGIIENLLYISPERKLLYATDIDGPGDGHPSHVYEHLSCFLPGVFALGAHSLPLSKADKQLHLWVAEGLAQTCYLSYADQASGLGPEEMLFTSQSSKWYPEFQKWQNGGMVRGEFPPGVHKDEDLKPVKDSQKRDYTNRRNTYLLRPETVESIFILWRVTGDVAWRNRGYEIFQSIERSTKTEVGYASVANVDIAEPTKQDSMPSYFLAETLKYLWLLFRDGDDRYDLDKVVFNTEAHPLPVFEWSKDEMKHFGIPS